MFVDGAFGRPAGGGTIDVRDKASGEIFATAGLAAEADVDRAVAAAKQAQPDWAARTYAERAGLLRAVADALTDRAKPLRELIMRETGCIGGKADYEIGAAVSELTEAAALASRATGEVLPTGHAGRFSLSERLPVGLVGVITPWNFPLILGMRVIAPAIALGNAVLLKPSPETPVRGGRGAGRAVPGAAGRRGGGPAAGQSPGHRDDPFHRVHRGRAADRGHGGRAAQEGLAGAGRQQRTARAG
jgi:benzaldehyde dehydrogenase (NAD)